MKEPQRLKLTDSPSIKEPEKRKLEATQLYLFDDIDHIDINTPKQLQFNNENPEQSIET